jgi:hypothetical protein
MKTRITSEAELLTFLKKNWNRITDFGYTEIIRESIEVYVSGKPSTYEIAESQIKEYISKYGNYKGEKPLFFEAEFD